MQKTLRITINKLLLLGIVLILLVACGSTTPPPDPTETAGPPNWSPCKKSDDPNIYQPIGPNNTSSLIYQNALLDPSSSLFNLENLSNVQLDAYLRLVKVVQQWSTFVDIPVQIGGAENQHFVRLTLTFVSPVLIEMVLLNHYLGNTPLSRDLFIERVNEKMRYFENRKEIVFLATFTASYTNTSIADPNSIQLRANVEEIKLFETKGHLIKNVYFDPPLGQDSCVSCGHLSGYIAYPMFVYRNNNCVATLDKEYATTLTLQVGNLTINGNEHAPITLSQKYHPLLGGGDSSSFTPMPIPEGSIIKEPRAETAPPNPYSGTKDTDLFYWQNMASYIWWHLSEP